MVKADLGGSGRTEMEPDETVQGLNPLLQPHLFQNFFALRTGRSLTGEVDHNAAARGADFDHPFGRELGRPLYGIVVEIGTETFVESRIYRMDPFKGGLS